MRGSMVIVYKYTYIEDSVWYYSTHFPDFTILSEPRDPAKVMLPSGKTDYSAWVKPIVLSSFRFLRSGSSQLTGRQVT